MKFLLSDLVRARFPNPLAVGREVMLPNGVHGPIKDSDGLMFRLKRKKCVNLVYWIMYDDEVLPINQVSVLFEPESQDLSPTSLTDDAIERFRISNDLTYEGLRRAVTLPDEPRPPSFLSSPQGCDLFQAYFQRHEPYCHLLLEAQPNVMWRVYFRGGIPTDFEGFAADYKESQLSKMAVFHATTPSTQYDEYAQFLSAQIPPPNNRYLWMADYARRKGVSDAVSFIDGEAITSGLLLLPKEQSPEDSQSQSRYTPRVMSKLMANPHRQLTALVLFALTEAESRAWPKPPGFDQWLYASYVEQ